MTAREERAREVLREAFAEHATGVSYYHPAIIRAMLSFADQPLAGEEGVTEADKRAAFRLLVGEKVGAGDGNTYVGRQPNAPETAQAFSDHRRAAFAAGMLRAAEIAEKMSDEVLAFWDRPGGPPGNGIRKTRPADVAAAIRQEVGA